METTVLLHSSASSPRQWRALSERLEHRHRVIAPDLEEFDSDAAETASFARDCERIMQIVQERDSAVHLVGHSYGGLIALRTAFEAPQRVRSLCLVEPVCFHLLEEAGEEIAFAEIAAVRDAQTAHVSDGDLLQAARCFVAYWMGADAWEAMPENGRSRVATAMPTVARKWPGAFQRTTASHLAAGSGRPARRRPVRRSHVAGDEPAARERRHRGVPHRAVTDGSGRAAPSRVIRCQPSPRQRSSLRQ
jgi:pimeloyl-ACP methyl ester carboxylesterase